MLAAKQQCFNWAFHCAPNNTTGDSISEISSGIRDQAVQHVYVALSLWFSPNLLSAAAYTNTTQEALETEFNRYAGQCIFSEKQSVNNFLSVVCRLDVMNFSCH